MHMSVYRDACVGVCVRVGGGGSQSSNQGHPSYTPESKLVLRLDFLLRLADPHDLLAVAPLTGG
jgi:hypothetical protein